MYEAILDGRKVAAKKPILSTSDDLDKFHKELQLLWSDTLFLIHMHTYGLTNTHTYNMHIYKYRFCAILLHGDGLAWLLVIFIARTVVKNLLLLKGKNLGKRYLVFSLGYMHNKSWIEAWYAQHI